MRTLVTIAITLALILLIVMGGYGGWWFRGKVDPACGACSTAQPAASKVVAAAPPVTDSSTQLILNELKRMDERQEGWREEQKLTDEEQSSRLSRLEQRSTSPPLDCAATSEFGPEMPVR